MLGMDRSAVSFPAQDWARTMLPARIERERGVSYVCTTRATAYWSCDSPRTRSELVNSYAAKAKFAGKVVSKLDLVFSNANTHF